MRLTLPLKLHCRAIAVQKNRASSNFPQDDTNYSGMLGMQRGLTADDDVGPHKHAIEGELLVNVVQRGGEFAHAQLHTLCEHLSMCVEQ